MKTKYNLSKIALLFSFLFIGGQINAQCPNNNSQYGTSNAPTTVGVLTTLSSCMYGGEYRLVNNMQAGSQYSFETCGDTDFDTQISVYDNSTGATVAYNDDYCGLQSKVTFTSNGNSVRVLIDKYYCTNQSSCMTLKVTRVTGAPAVNPCNSVTSLTCGSPGTFSLSGPGAWNSLGGPWSTPGAEKVFSYTPVATGPHTITVTNSGYYVDLYTKTGSCSSSGWTYRDDIYSSGSVTVTMSAGVTVYLLIDDENTSTSSGTVTVGCYTPPADPCNSITALTCGVASGYSLGAGNGSWNSLGGPWSTPGNEAVFSYTPTATGSYSISTTHNGGYSWVDLLFKSGSCSSAGWSYVDDILFTANNSVTLTGGVSYLFLIDDENTSASSGTISIACYVPPVDPCNSVTTIATCGNSYNFSLSGSGVWNPPGPWGSPGEEAVFTYTAPVSGAYPITVTNSGYYVDLFYKSGSCGSSGWSYVSDIYSNETNIVNLTGGVTYLFLIDDENTSANSGTISVGCPCIPPPGGIDATVNVTSNTGYSSTTLGACNDCSYRSSNDRVVELNITCAGTYTISTCSGTSWDTYLYLSTAPCSGSIIALNDDNCGLQSSITASLNPGTYYVAVEGWSSYSQGAFTLNVSKACNMSATASSPQYNCGYNVSCSGASDGSASVSLNNACGAVSYAWSTGGSVATESGLGAGTVSVTATDGFGCSASASTTLTEPTPVVVDAGTDEIVYYGYGPLSCADLSGSATGGCAGYAYSWSSGDNTANATVCPSTTTDYTLTVTDQNGCTGTDEVTICAVNVICYAGNSGNQKVELCHIPPGNPANAHDICIAGQAVADHLSHGCELGSCGEIWATCGSDGKLANPAPSMEADNTNDKIEEMSSTIVNLSVAPNPFDAEFNMSVTLSESGSYRVEVLDSYGRVVKALDAVGFEANKDQSINVKTGDMSKGMYLVRVIRSNSSIAGQSKVIIKR